MLSEGARPYGIAVIASASLAMLGLEATQHPMPQLSLNPKVSPLKYCAFLAASAVATYPFVFFMLYLVPGRVMNHKINKSPMAAWACLSIRWLEIVIFAAVAFLVARPLVEKCPNGK